MNKMIEIDPHIERVIVIKRKIESAVVAYKDI